MIKLIEIRFHSRMTSKNDFFEIWLIRLCKIDSLDLYANSQTQKIVKRIKRSEA